MKKQIKRISMKKGKVFKNNTGVSEYVNLIKKNIVTPIATLNFCAIHKPHYFSGSPIPRYKVSLLFDPEDKSHRKYLDSLEKLAVENDVQTIGRLTDEGLIIISYQGRNIPETFLLEKGKKTPDPIFLDHDLPKGFKCKVHFDLKRYFDKFGQKNAFTYSPTKVIFYLDEESKELIEVNDGDDEDSGY
jgi:hypothetical protein